MFTEYFKLVENWEIELQLDFVVLEPTQLSQPADVPLSELVAASGGPWLTDSDPVHLSADVYRELLPAAGQNQTKAVNSGT
jgi:hypothetical protein